MREKLEASLDDLQIILTISGSNMSLRLIGADATLENHTALAGSLQDFMHAHIQTQSYTTKTGYKYSEQSVSYGLEPGHEDSIEQAVEHLRIAFQQATEFAQGDVEDFITSFTQTLNSRTIEDPVHPRFNRDALHHDLEYALNASLARDKQGNQSMLMQQRAELDPASHTPEAPVREICDAICSLIAKVPCAHDQKPLLHARRMAQVKTAIYDTLYNEGYTDGEIEVLHPEISGIVEDVLIGHCELASKKRGVPDL